MTTLQADQKALQRGRRERRPRSVRGWVREESERLRTKLEGFFADCHAHSRH